MAREEPAQPAGKNGVQPGCAADRPVQVSGISDGGGDDDEEDMRAPCRHDRTKRRRRQLEAANPGCYACSVPQNEDVRQFGIVGTGRVARALVHSLRVRGFPPPLLWGRSRARCQEAATTTKCRAAETLAALGNESDIIAIAVSDDAIAEIVRKLAEARPDLRGKLVFHVSGGSGTTILAPLLARDADIAAIHPAMTFTGEPDLECERMAGACFAVTGASEESLQRARSLVEALGGVPVAIAEQHRALYHAALCHSANHLVTLFCGALDALSAAGIADPAGLVAPLARASLENAISSGFEALSGPLKRGDAGTIRNHLAALEEHAPDLLPAYRAMAIATMEELGRRGSQASGTSLLELLEGSGTASSPRPGK